MLRATLFFCLLTGAFTHRTQAQIVLQSGLENWTAGLPDGFVGPNTTLPSDSILEVSEPVHGGNKAMRLQLGSNGGGLLSTVPVTVVANELYEVRFWVRGRALVAGGLFDGRPENGGFAQLPPSVEANDTTWRYVLQTVEATNSTNAAEFVLDVRPIGDASYVVVDDITINASALPEPMNVSIAQIQTSTAFNGASPLNFEFVRTQGIVTGLGTNRFFLQDGPGAWNGIEVLAAPPANWALGDAVLLYGTVDEESIPNDLWFRSRTRIIAVPFVQRTSTGNPVPEAIDVSTWDLEDEEWESVLVRVHDLECTGEADAFTFEWPAANWQGSTRVDDLLHFFSPTLGAMYTINGIVYFDGQAKLLPRSDADFGPGVGIAEPKQRTMVLSPNPANTTVRIADLDMTGPVNARLFDGAGRMVLETALGPNRLQLDVSQLPNGIYHLRVEGNYRSVEGALSVVH